MALGNPREVRSTEDGGYVETQAVTEMSVMQLLMQGT